MRIRLVFSFLVLAIGLVASSGAQAFMFGKDETIHKIEDVGVTGPAGEPLFLGYKTTTQYFIAGLYVQDDGYVLGMESDHGKYFPMPTGDELKNFQGQRLLPDPLPPYKLAALDYVVGYSLWIAVPIIVVVYLIGWMRRKKTAAAVAGPAGAGGTPPAE